MRNLLEFILLHLVKHPDAIEVTETELADHTEFTLKVHPEDIGRIIGRQGRTIQAIRTLAKVRAIQDNLRVRINVDDSASEETATAESSDVEAQDESQVETQVESPTETVDQVET